MGTTQDTEITLGTGKLLGMFFALVAICAAFFTMGYLFGRSSVAASGSTAGIVAPGPGGAPSVKPSAGGNRMANTQTCAAGADNCTPAGSASDSGSGAAARETAVQPPTQPPAATVAPELRPASASAEIKGTATGSYMVQVAAVSRQEDADILVNALRKKQYAVSIVSNLPGDSLFHVQIGPFSDSQEAEAMRTRLANDGYNAIVKK